jgi:hypothetical protein
VVCGQQDTISESQVPVKLIKNFGLFEESDPIEITLRFDMNTYLRTKPKEDYLKANMIFHLNENDSIVRNIKLRTRGEYRNINCYFAPIELNFKKVDFGYKDLNKIGKIKMVAQCDTRKDYEDYLLREYLTYKLFNVMTDTSFRVRLLIINYVDTVKKRKPVRQYGFFIEPVDILASRLNLIQTKQALNQKYISERIMDKLAIFNYMIGNYDWGIPGEHNVKIFRPATFSANNKPIALPYDFDWTGIVNPSYGIPADNVGITNIRQRIFAGICRSREVYTRDLEEFSRKKEELYRVINEFPYLSQSSKKDMIAYIEEFYNLFRARNNIVEIFLNNCKKL